MKRDFNKEHENYNIVFDNYLKASRNRYKHGKKIILMSTLKNLEIYCQK